MNRADPFREKSFRLYKLLNGAIVALALLSAFDLEALSNWRAMGIIGITLGASAFAEAFSRALGEEIATRRRVRVLEAWAVLRASMLIMVPGAV
ncbi:MAG: hypothetical protein WD155_01225 [Burkholderiales bacterium]